MAITRRGTGLAILTLVGLKSGRAYFDGATGPDPTIESLFNPRPRNIEVQETQQGEFQATIQNTGSDGNVLVRLYWIYDEEHLEASLPTSEPLLLEKGLTKAREETFFLNDGERRTISFAPQIPRRAVGFYFTQQIATFGAVVKNNGGGGQIRASLRNSAGLDLDEQSQYIGRDERRRITFDGTYPLIGDEWEIKIEPE